MRILFVEDDAGFSRLAEALARRAGHDCEIVATVASAKSRLRQGPFDLVALDLELPDGDRLEVCQEMLAGLGHDVPIVVITGRSRPGLLQGCQELGFALIEKSAEFSATFRRLLTRLEEQLASVSQG